MDGSFHRGTSRCVEEQPGRPAPEGSAVLVTKRPEGKGTGKAFIEQDMLDFTHVLVTK
jgi:hypothetical protein